MSVLRAGNKNALKHGRYTADAIANRREVAALLRAMKALARDARYATFFCRGQRRRVGAFANEANVR